VLTAAGLRIAGDRYRGHRFRLISKRCAAVEFGASGFTGPIIHPAQVELVQTAFTPDAEAIAHARRIVEGFAASQGEGKGAFALDGKMIDKPLVSNAEKVLERAKAAGTA
jgi:citrate lyase subunit beta/citryl-CoA lyase